MIYDLLKRVMQFVLLGLSQVLVFNGMDILNGAFPLIYVYFIIMFPRNYPKWAILLWSFAMGVTMDMFTNTPGVAAMSLTLIGALQPYLLELFLPRNADDYIKTSIHTLGFGKFLSLTYILVNIYCLAFYTIEAFSFFNFFHWFMCIIGSSLLTTVLILALESLRKK
ncbi:MAG: rod shape-determining protein MreD [Prevotella sp.]|nr:rod shape-determining protein MreD [Prevotella sp.]